MHKSIGQRFAESEAYKNMQSSRRKESDAYQVGSFHEEASLEDTKALSTTPASGGVLVEPTRVPGIAAPPDRRLFLRDLLPSQQSTGVVEYVQETGFTNNAAMVAEGGTKPESNLTFELISESAHVLAHVLTASRQILSDAAMLQHYVNTKLVYGLKFKEEAQLLYGDGTDENLSGLLAHADRQTYTESTDGQVGDTKLHSLRRAITLVTLSDYVASGVVLHPSDKEELDLLQGTDDHFLHLDVSSGNVPSYFRVPVIETPAITAGEAAVGAFNLAARIHDVWQATVQLFEQHADYATTNRVLVRAEERLALANERAEAIVHVTFDGAV